MVTIGMTSLGKSDHATQKIFAPEDPFAEVLLKKMSCTTIASGVPIGVTGQPMVHACGEIGLWGLNQGMDVIGQPGER